MNNTRAINKLKREIDSRGEAEQQRRPAFDPKLRAFRSGVQVNRDDERSPALVSAPLWIIVARAIINSYGVKD